jgi:hypothetical protein
MHEANQAWYLTRRDAGASGGECNAWAAQLAEAPSDFTFVRPAKWRKWSGRRGNAPPIVSHRRTNAGLSTERIPVNYHGPTGGKPGEGEDVWPINHFLPDGIGARPWRKHFENKKSLYLEIDLGKSDKLNDR